MRKFLKSVVAAVLVASMSVTGSATIASAKTTTSSSSASAVKTHSVTLHGITFKNVTLDWGSKMNVPVKESYKRKDNAENYGGFPFTAEEEAIMRRALYREQSLDEYNKMNPYNKTTLTDDDVLAYFEYNCYSPEEAKYRQASISTSKTTGDVYISYTSKFDTGKWNIDPEPCCNANYFTVLRSDITITDAIYYAKNIAGYTKAQVTKMYKTRAVEYLMDKTKERKVGQIKLALADGYDLSVSKSEANKYWDKCFRHKIAMSDAVINTWSYKISDMQSNMVYFDVLGRGFTKKDLLEGNLPSGGMFTLTDRAKTVFKKNPALEKLAILSKSYQNTHSEFEYEDTDNIFLTGAEAKKLNTYLKKATKGYNVKAYNEIDGVTTWNGDVIAQLYLVYNYLPASQVKSLNTYLNKLCKTLGLETKWNTMFVDDRYYDLTSSKIDAGDIVIRHG